jgi:hypothetical protein
MATPSELVKQALDEAAGFGTGDWANRALAALVKVATRSFFAIRAGAGVKSHEISTCARAAAAIPTRTQYAR